MKKILIKIFGIIFFPFRFLRLKDYVVLESYPVYSDNTLIMYEYLLDKGFFIGKRVFWINLNNKNIESKNGVSIIHYDTTSAFSKILSEFRINYYLSRSKYYIFSHQNYSRLKPRKDQFFLNLTHGISLKDTRGNYPSPDFSSKILVLSETTKKMRCKSFGGGLDKMEITGYPRNDLLFLNKRDKIDCEQKIIIWLPTFRRQKETERNDTGTRSKNDFPIIKNEKGFEYINNVLKKNNIILWIKLHPAQDLKYIRVSTQSNIRVILDTELKQKKIHLYEILALSDALITDYSSVYIDYLLKDKMIAFTMDDFDSFKNNKGFLIENPKEYMPGHFIYNILDLEKFIVDISQNKDIYSEERTRIKKKFHKYLDGNSCDRVYSVIRNFEKKGR